MKGLILPAIMILLTTMFISVMPTENDGAIYGDTVRLHILAQSDSEEDQRLKLCVRDAVLSEYGQELSVYQNVDDAKRQLSERLQEIESFADRTVNSLGYDYKTKVTLTEEWYDTREYESFTLPKGYYTSLRIIIGEGEGQNWWCVMFPPLCLDASTSTAYTKDEELLITKKYNVRFKILEIISELSK